MTDSQDCTHRDVADFYDHVYHRDASSDALPDRHLIGLAKRLGVKAGQKIVDIGCGTGEWLSVCADASAEIAGIDISMAAVEVCRQRLPGGVFHCGPAETLPFPDATFDLVTCLGSLEHFLDQPGALREMVRIAKPGARVLILVPNAGFLTYRLGLYRGTQQRQIRETIRPLEEWQAMFAESGLEVQQKWRDLHVANFRWITRKPLAMIPLRLVQVAALAVWPVAWQYQVYHLCRLSPVPEKAVSLPIAIDAS